MRWSSWVSGDLVESLSTAENLTPAGRGRTVRVIDTHWTPHPDDDSAIAIVRGRLEGQTEPLPATGGLTVRNGAVTYDATISDIDSSDQLRPQRTSVSATTTVPEGMSTAIEAGDTQTIGNATVATVTSVQQLGPTDGGRRLVLGFELETLQSGDWARFAGRQLQIGTDLPFRTDEYALTTSVLSVGGRPVEGRSRTVRVTSTVPRSVAEVVESGDRFRIGNRTVARIESVASFPVPDPDQLVGAVRERRLPVTGSIVGLDGTRRGSSTTARLRVEWTNVEPSRATALRRGMAETHRGADARVVGLSSEPATVILRTESGEIYARDHPINVDVTVGLDANFCVVITDVHRYLRVRLGKWCVLGSEPDDFVDVAL